MKETRSWESWDVADVLTPRTCEVFETEPEPPVLYDAKGRPLIRPRAPLGFDTSPRK